MELYVGLALMLLGVVLFLTGRRAGSRSVRVEASGGSVAVGGSNKGSITNVNLGAPPLAPHETHWLTWVAIVVELIGIGVTIWHAFHLAAK
ncbi:MAG: hypothetical protein K5880_09825 [Hydrogenophaga sp.]|uniref:hypothetical protein n=1 Tax=Hydrogenophaga sp. TaxID=1904254 RepID=UPI002634EC4F|nr:hypothetical protein [Hydrogenophaga sp.]MCV0438919.1 hypothetical protein [Hydrogenophaga sp.]